MQRYVKEKSIAYGIAGVLLAIVLTGVIYQFNLQPTPQPTPLQFQTFSSYEELKTFLETRMDEAKQFYKPLISPFFGESDSFETLSSSVKGAPEHSTTNVQVAGVDEADIVKIGEEGEYLYVVSKGDVYILRAHPPEQAEVLSKISVNETYSIEIYVKGDRLAILGNHYPYYYPIPIFSDLGTYIYSEEAFIKVYDISDRKSPILKRDVKLNGTLSGSRMIGDYVYGVVNQPAIDSSSYETEIVVALPKIYTNNVPEEVQPTDIHYVSIPDVFYYFTTVISVNITNDAQEITHESFLTGATALIYVSLSNMYLAIPNTKAWISFEVISGARDETLIYRIKLDEEEIILEAEGSVSGYVLNQFSMDEHDEFFRVATTEWTSEISKNSLFILDMDLAIVGELENIAPGERIYSARFINDRCYLVTFQQIDPFFVIDLADPYEPEILGELKIPGFSGYLHPYDEDYIIGVGKQDNNVKLSLFDVTDVSSPIEAVPPYIVQGDWSDTTVLMDHKAFLFDKSKELLALPVSINSFQIEEDDHYTNIFRQGEFVFNINLIDGFVLKGNVTHQENSSDGWDSGYWVKRALHIGDVLYTISDRKIKMNNLEDLALINEIELL